MSNTVKPISVQLYTLREEAAKDFPAVLRRLAEIGYKGVEPAGFFSFTPQDFRKYVEDLGMVISSTHSPWARLDNTQEVIDTCGILGVNLVAGGYGTKEFESVEAIRRTADEVAEINAKLKAAGLTLTLHNHAWEFEKIDGRLKYDIFAELCPDVSFELDTYWAANFGDNDPVEMVRRFGSRSPLLHIKDGPFVRPESRYNEATSTLEVVNGPEAALLPLGAGKNNIPGIIGAMDAAVTQWLVVEQDNGNKDMLECVEESYLYLTSRGLAAGNR